LKSRRTLAFGSFSEWVEVDLGSRIFIKPPGGPASISYPVSLTTEQGGTATLPPTSPEVSSLFPAPPGSLPIVSPDSGVLTIPLRSNEKVIRFFNASEGDPSYASGRLLRMLYLSATTITTLGPGDITATSSLARFLVGLEAVLGVVVIGLFLNAVASRLRGKVESEPQPRQR
jgi:hypothetical protein